MPEKCHTSIGVGRGLHPPPAGLLPPAGSAGRSGRTCGGGPGMWAWSPLTPPPFSPSGSDTPPHPPESAFHRQVMDELDQVCDHCCASMCVVAGLCVLCVWCVCVSRVPFVRWTICHQNQQVTCGSPPVFFIQRPPVFLQPQTGLQRGGESLGRPQLSGQYVSHKCHNKLGGESKAETQNIRYW